MQVVINKCFLLNPKKIAQNHLIVFQKRAKSATFIPKNDVTEPKISYSNNQLKSNQLTKGQFKG